LFNGKETHNTASSGKYTRTRLSSTMYDLTQYGNSLGYTQFHIVETKLHLLTYHKRLEQMKCLNTLMNTKYNTILTTEISRMGEGNQYTFHKRTLLAKQIKFISRFGF
jgi:hypothetical protein